MTVIVDLHLLLRLFLLLHLLTWDPFPLTIVTISTNFLPVFASCELLPICSYSSIWVLTFTPDSRSPVGEPALFVYGALASKMQLDAFDTNNC